MEDENIFISIDFDKGIFPRKYTCDGEDISPLIHIDRVHSPYLAVIIDDWVGPSERFTHWIMWDINSRASIPENIPKAETIANPFPAVQGTNDFGTIGYRGPCPPSGEIHTYYINVYGLDAKLDLPPGSKRDALDEAMKGHMKQYGGQAIATYNR